MSKPEVDLHRAQILRQQCTRHFAGKSIHDVVGALEMLIADVVLIVPSQDEAGAIAGAEAIMADVRNVIRERLAGRKAAH